MPKHWAEDFHSPFELEPRVGDEELFLSIELIGLDVLIERYEMRGFYTADVIERFCVEHHRMRESAKPGVWVRYQIWQDRQRGVDTLSEIGPF